MKTLNSVSQIAGSTLWKLLSLAKSKLNLVASGALEQGPGFWSLRIGCLEVGHLQNKFHLSFQWLSIVIVHFNEKWFNVKWQLSIYNRFRYRVFRIKWKQIPIYQRPICWGTLPVLLCIRLSGFSIPTRLCLRCAAKWNSPHRRKIRILGRKNNCAHPSCQSFHRVVVSDVLWILSGRASDSPVWQFDSFFGKMGQMISCWSNCWWAEGGKSKSGMRWIALVESSGANTMLK